VANNERFIAVIQKMMDVIHYNNTTYLMDKFPDWSNFNNMFPNGQLLFWSETVKFAPLLRDMDIEFGIITYPKFDEAQTDYSCFVYPPTVMCVPSTTPDLTKTGMILETLCYESADTTIKEFYDTLLKTKVSRDNESEAMLDIMFANRLYDISAVFYWGEVYGALNGESTRSNFSIASWLEKNERKVNATIEKITDIFTR